jgi:hypothetical protein
MFTPAYSELGFQLLAAMGQNQAWQYGPEIELILIRQTSFPGVC